MTLQISNGQSIPIVGLGLSVFPEPPEVVEKAVETALEIGYRHFDTAFLYNTELHLGKALKKAFDEGKVKREELYIVTKLPQIAMHPERVARFMENSLKDLQLDYVDLYLIHWPFGMLYRGNDKDVLPRGEDGTYLMDPVTDIEAVWKEMEKLVENGKARAIGLSNFNEKQMERILKIAKIKPVNNQVELHAHFQQTKFREFCKKNGISVTAYFPLGGPQRNSYPNHLQITEVPNLLEDPVVLQVAKKHNRSPAQVLLRFLTQIDVIVIPKSSNATRQKENLEILKFSLDPADIEQLKKIDRGEMARSCFNFPGAEKHAEFPFDHVNFIPPPQQ